MHRPIKDRLEEFLAGTGDRQTLKEFEAHLEHCEECFHAVGEMRAQSRLLHSLRSPAPMTPPGGDFYARVMQRVESAPKPAFWSLFLDPVFGRRLVYGTITALVLMSTYLVSTESQASPMLASSAPEAIFAGDDSQHLGQNAEEQRDNLLVNLATYQE